MSLTLRIARFAVVLALVFPLIALAQAPLRIIVPVAAGSTSDLVARLLGDRLATSLKRPVLVENRPGATGRIAVDALRNAPAPADTVLVAPLAAPVIVPLAFAKPGYAASDLVPVSQLATFDYALAVSARREFRTFAEFAAWARVPGNLASFGATGAGSVPHFIGAHLAREARLPLTFVPFASLSQVEADLVGGHIASAVTATSDVIALHRGGRVRILATSGRVRSPLLPDVPTFRELGMPDLDAVGWTAMFASVRMPAAEVEALSAAVRAVLADAEVRVRLHAAGLDATGTTPRALAAIIVADIAYWQPIIRASGFSGDAP